jgi:hypothetical protein
MHPNMLKELLKQLVGCLRPGFGLVSLDRDLKVYMPNKFPGDRQVAVLGTPSPRKPLLSILATYCGPWLSKTTIPWRLITIEASWAPPRLTEANFKI